MMRVGIRATISAAHRGEDGALHGHSWEIRAWFEEGRDALELRAEVFAAVSLFDHQELLYELSTSEGLIRAIAEQLPEAVEIEALRPVEGIFVRWVK